MADKRISQLIERVDIANNDVLPIVASGATTTNKVTISTIQDWMQENLDVGVTSVGITLGSSGTDVNVTGSPITTSGNITINIPDASASARGVVTTGSQVFGGVKTFANGLSLPAVGGSNQITRIVNIGSLHEGTASVNQIGFNSGNNIYFGKGLNNGGVISWNNSAVRYYTLPDADGTIALTSQLDGYVTLNTAQTITAQKTFTTSGSSDTMIISHGSGSGIALDVIKAGNGEGLRVTKTSGTGNAVTITGGLLSAEAATLTGALNGTNATFTGAGSTFVSTTTTGGSDMRISSGASAGNVGTFSNHPLSFVVNNSVIATIAVGGAATFSSSVSAGQLFLSTPSNLVATINSTNPSGCLLTWQTNGTIIGDIGTAQMLFGTGGADTFGISGRGARSLILGTNNTARLTINSSGATTLSGALNGTSASFTGNVAVGTNSYTVPSGYTGVGINNATNGGLLDLLLNDVKKGELYITSTSFNMYGFAGVGLNLTVDNNSSKGLSIATTGAATFSSSVTANSLLVERSASRNMLGISSISLPTSGAEEGVAVVKTNSNLWQMSLVGYAADSKGMRIYNTGGAGNTSLEVATGAGTAFIVNGSGNVGIGTASPGTKLDVVGSDIELVRLASTATNGSYLSFRNSGTLNGAIGTGSNIISGLTNSDLGLWTTGLMAFLTGGTERMRITSDAYLRMASGTGGIQFNGDTAAANALDDYEEGDCTFAITFGGASVGITYARNTGRYTKVGRLVTITGAVELTNKGSSVGNALLTGLPFAPPNNVAFYASVSLSNIRNITFTNQMQAYVNVNSTNIILNETTNAGVYSVLTETDFSNNSEFIINVSYFTN